MHQSWPVAICVADAGRLDHNRCSTRRSLQRRLSARTLALGSPDGQGAQGARAMAAKENAIMTTEYPLSWPDHIPRREAARESGKFKTSLAGALKNVRDSVR